MLSLKKISIKLFDAYTHVQPNVHYLTYIQDMGFVAVRGAGTKLSNGIETSDPRLLELYEIVKEPPHGNKEWFYFWLSATPVKILRLLMQNSGNSLQQLEAYTKDGLCQLALECGLIKND